MSASISIKRFRPCHGQTDMMQGIELPELCQKTLARVTDALPVPTTCRYCGAGVRVVENSAIYGRAYGNWPYSYQCTQCDAHVGLHPFTDLPLGTLANTELREARVASKAAFSRMRDGRGFSRSRAYEWLAGEMNISKDACHFGWFDLADCELAKSICDRDNMLNSAMGRAFATAKKSLKNNR